MGEACYDGVHGFLLLQLITEQGPGSGTAAVPWEGRRQLLD
ncbi:hypothetical protein ARZXY2_898 [Arthrobacter sp. ZXY-2]|nr:hypothetical protein ARZXY2_898 [Arthrobacter sp. ZXY-2]